MFPFLFFFLFFQNFVANYNIMVALLKGELDIDDISTGSTRLGLDAHGRMQIGAVRAHTG